jgi:hypothetical protein
MPITIENMQQELPTRFQQSYTRREANDIIPKELWLMDELCCDRSAVHKKAIRELHRSIKKERMNLY